MGRNGLLPIGDIFGLPANLDNDLACLDTIIGGTSSPSSAPLAIDLACLLSGPDRRDAGGVGEADALTGNTVAEAATTRRLFRRIFLLPLRWRLL